MREKVKTLFLSITFSLEALSLIQVDGKSKRFTMHMPRIRYLRGPNSVKIRVTTNRSRGSLKEPEQRLGKIPLAEVEPYDDRPNPR